MDVFDLHKFAKFNESKHRYFSGMAHAVLDIHTSQDPEVKTAALHTMAESFRGTEWHDDFDRGVEAYTGMLKARRHTRPFPNEVDWAMEYERAARAYRRKLALTLVFRVAVLTGVAATIALPFIGGSL